MKTVEEARGDVVKAFGLQALCFPEAYPLEEFDAMQEARKAAFAARDAALDDLIRAVQAEMPCYRYNPALPNDGLPFMQNCDCPSCQAKEDG